MMDKRREPRVTDSTVQVHQCLEYSDLAGESITCEIVDVSAHRLKLKTNQALVTNTVLNITLTIDDPAATYQLRGEIIWTEIDDNACCLGIRFSEAGDTDIDAWATYVNNMTSQQ